MAQFVSPRAIHIWMNNSFIFAHGFSSQYRKFFVTVPVGDSHLALGKRRLKQHRLAERGGFEPPVRG